MNHSWSDIDYDPNDPLSFKPIESNPLVLDLSKCRYEYDVHLILKDKFGLPDYYGMNWDALWDCLRDLFFGCPNWVVLIFGYHAMSRDMQKLCVPMLKIFDDVHDEVPNVSFFLVS